MNDNIQELSFQNVVDTILTPQGIKVGGYPDDLFIDLGEKEREKWQCNICYSVLRDPQQCNNKHKFCATCVFAWSMTYGANSDKCPVCRCIQREYANDVKINTEISNKWVKCPELGCPLRCTLQDFLRHSHGMRLFDSSNASTLENLRRTSRRPAPIAPISTGAEIVFLPSLGGTQTTVREGRNLLQDMMLVLHLEMELRRRAIDRFSSTRAGAASNSQLERDRHMTEVLAIQEQMQEITGFLNILFSIPPNQQAQRARLAGGMGSFPGVSAHSDSTSDSDSESDTSAVDSQYRLSDRSRLRRQQQPNPVISGNRNTSGPGAETVSTVGRPSSSLNRTIRRSEIRQDIGGVASGSEGVQTLDLTRPRVSNSRPTGTGTSTNRIDINNVQSLSSSSRPANQSTGSNQTNTAIGSSQTANSVIRSGEGGEPGAHNTAQPETDASEAVPRASSTFQAALGNTTPSTARPNATDMSQETSQLAPSPSSGTQQIVTPTSSHRPAPPRHPAPPNGPGRPINTNRLRRRINVNSNSQSTQNRENPQNSSMRRGRQTDQSPGVNPSRPAQQSSGITPTSGPTQPSPGVTSNRQTQPSPGANPNRTTQQSSGVVPSRTTRPSPGVTSNRQTQPSPGPGANPSRPSQQSSGATSSRPTQPSPGVTSNRHTQPSPGPGANPTRSAQPSPGVVRNRPTQQSQATESTSTERPLNNAQTRSVNQSGGGHSTLPATSGGLMRARRRSEIQQQIHRDMSNDEES